MSSPGHTRTRTRALRPGFSFAPARSDRRNVHVKTWEPFFLLGGAGWNVCLAYDGIAIKALQVDIKTPESVQMSQHFIRGFP